MEYKEIELKPCPFCGGHAIFKTISLSHNSFSVGFKFKIECEECAVSLPKIYEINLSLTDDGSINDLNDERGEAANDWNTRSDDGRCNGIHRMQMQ